MAAAKPNAVANSASAMPGATTARLVVCDFEMPMKLFMMPQTVPNRPTKGAVAPMVASTPVPRAIFRAKAASMRSSREATRSFMPSRSSAPEESCHSATAASMNFPATPLALASCSTPSTEECTRESARKALRSRDLAAINSRLLASHTVQVTIEAMSRPIKTPCTTMSALRNMPHGVRSRGSAPAPIRGPATGSVSWASCASAVSGASTTRPAQIIASRTPVGSQDR